jgi:hypothetical protein
MDRSLRKSGDVDLPLDVDPEQIIKDWVRAACLHERFSLAEIAAAVGSNPTDLDRFRDLESYRMPTLAHIRRLSEVTGHPIDVSLTRALADLGTECRASYGTMSHLCVTPAVLHRPKDMARWLVNARRAFGSVLSIRDLAAHLNVSKEVVGTRERRPDVNAPNPSRSGRLPGSAMSGCRPSVSTCRRGAGCATPSRFRRRAPWPRKSSGPVAP